MPGRRKGFAASLVMLVLVAPLPSLAGPYEDGDSAFRRKDYAIAMKHWQPLADGGMRARKWASPPCTWAALACRRTTRWRWP